MVGAADMPLDDAEVEGTGAALAAAMRAVRDHRRLRQIDVARAMGVSLRTYQDLEAGSGRMQLDQLAAFALATRSDQLALVAAVKLRSAALAVASADTKAMTIMMRLTHDLLTTLGDDGRKLRPNDLSSAVRPVLIALAREIIERDGGPAGPPPRPGS